MTARLGSFEDLMKESEESLRPIAWRLRDVVIELHPDTWEVVRLGDRAATYGFGPRKMSEGYVYIMSHKNWVNLGFFQGASLPDNERLLEGTGARMRHIKVSDIVTADSPAVRTLIEAARDERRTANGLD